MQNEGQFVSICFTAIFEANPSKRSYSIDKMTDFNNTYMHTRNVRIRLDAKDDLGDIAFIHCLNKLDVSAIKTV